MSKRNPRAMSIGPAAVLIAFTVMAGSAPPVLGQLHLPHILPSKTPTQPKGEARSGAKASHRLNLKLPKLNESQLKLGTEVAGGTFGGSVAGGAFGSFAGPAGTVIGAAGGALAGGIGAAAGYSFKDFARRHWSWH
jgi:hypothetical protein